MEWLWDLLVNLHWGAVGQIIMIDILLGGDNAVVIALACRNLPHEQRLKGVFWGTFGAIALRVVLITFAVMLLDLPFLKMVGAALLVWIGVKLLVPEDEHESEKIEGSAKLLGAIKTIIVADFVMSLDNVIAIAGAAQQAHDDHQTMLVIFGLLVSVPFIVFGSQMVLKLLDRFPVIVWIGGGLLSSSTSRMPQPITIRLRLSVPSWWCCWVGFLRDAQRLRPRDVRRIRSEAARHHKAHVSRRSSSKTAEQLFVRLCRLFYSVANKAQRPSSATAVARERETSVPATVVCGALSPSLPSRMRRGMPAA